MCLVSVNDITNIVVKYILEVNQGIALKNTVICLQIQIIIHIFSFFEKEGRSRGRRRNACLAHTKCSVNTVIIISV